MWVPVHPAVCLNCSRILVHQHVTREGIGTDSQLNSAYWLNMIHDLPGSWQLSWQLHETDTTTKACRCILSIPAGFAARAADPETGSSRPALGSANPKPQPGNFRWPPPGTGRAGPRGSNFPRCHWTLAGLFIFVLDISFSALESQRLTEAAHFLKK